MAQRNDGSRAVRRPTLLATAPLLASAALVASDPRSVAAQTEPDEGEIRGQVVNEGDEEGISRAVVYFLNDDQQLQDSTTADSDGFFQLPGLEPGAFYLRVEHLAYVETTTPEWSVEAGEELVVVVRMDPDQIPLAPLEVTGSTQSQSPVLEGFYDRMERAVTGTFFDRQDIEERNPGRVTDLMRDIPGVRLEQAPGGVTGDRIPTFGRALPGRPGGCPVQVFVDGVLATRADGGVSLDELASPQSLEGMEIYRGLSGVPAEFLNEDARCGVIALWTRRGG